jgi:hypothetical protein
MRLVFLVLVILWLLTPITALAGDQTHSFEPTHDLGVFVPNASNINFARFAPLLTSMASIIKAHSSLADGT